MAENLAMRRGANVSQQLRRFDGAQANAKQPPEMSGFLKVAWEEKGGKGNFVMICTLTRMALI